MVRTLLGDLRPAWAGLPVERLDASGSEKALFRVGDDLLARLPRQPGGGAGIDKEARWLPYVGAGLPVAVPQVVAVGGPAAMVVAPGVDVAEGPHWYHGDLAAENLLVRDGRLAPVLHFGGLSVGDPTVDLVPAWEVLDPPARAVFRDAVAVDDATWLRGRAWALSLALMTFPSYRETMPGRCASRLAVARAVLADAANV